MNILPQQLWMKVPRVCYVVTTNAFIRKDGTLVMGRGAARQAVNKFPSIEYECGLAVRQAPTPYRFLMIRSPLQGEGFGIFQVKYHWQDDADLELIELSMQALTDKCLELPHINFRMNYPGIGNGKLKRDEVEPILQQWNIPNLTVCFKPAAPVPV